MQVRPTATAESTTPGFETLDRRVMFAAGAVLILTGTNGNDLITIIPGAVRGEVVVRGARECPDGTRFKNINALKISGRGGNDQITVQDGVRLLDSKLEFPVSLLGGAGKDSLVGGKNTRTDFDGGPGADGIVGRGRDAISFKEAGHGVQVRLHDDKVRDDGNGTRDDVAGIATVIGTRFDDTIVGGLPDGRSFRGTQVLSGRKGDDLITALQFATTLSGDEGKDTLLGANRNDLLDGGAGDDFIDGGGGANTLRTQGGKSGVTVRLDLGTAKDGYGNHDILANLRHVLGTTNNDTLVGDELANHLRGNGGRDSLHGGAGDDQLFSNAPADSPLSTLLGGDGNDILRVNAAHTGLTDGGDGTDTIRTGSGTNETVRVE